MSEFKTLSEITKDYFIKCFYVCDGNKSLLKRKLQLSIRTVRNHCHEYKLFYDYGAFYQCEMTVDEIRPMEEIVKEYFSNCFYICRGNRTEVSKHLGIAIRTARIYAKEYGLDYEELKKEKHLKDQKKHTEEELLEDIGHKNVTPKQRDNWYNRDRY